MGSREVDPAERRERIFEDFLWGAVGGAIGLALTLVRLAALQPGWVIAFAWGCVAYGGFRLLRGLIRYAESLAWERDDRESSSALVERLEAAGAASSEEPLQMPAKTAEVFTAVVLAATERRTPTYGEVGRAAGLTPVLVLARLHAISQWCEANGYPHLNAIVVNARSQRPGRAYARNGEELSDTQFQEAKEAAFAFDWTAVGFPGVNGRGGPLP